VSATHATAENPFAGQGAVMLDIGDDVGALVVEMPPEMVGVEVEIRPAGAGDRQGEHVHHPHVAVVERHTPEGTVPSLVFPSLGEGSYELYEKGGGPVLLMAPVRGDQVTELSWPR
jgi:hypothetical protein